VRRAVPVLLALLSAAACGDDTPAPRPQSPPPQRDASAEAGGGSTARFATYNMHLFFDTVCDSGSCRESDFEQVRTEAEFAEQTELRARGIARLEADVVALQEVENQVAFDALVARLAADGYEYPVARLGETGAPGSLDVAVLARGATLDAVKTHRENPITRPDGSETRFTRELLEVHLSMAERKVVFFTAHYRSKAGGDDAGRRIAEAKATREIMLSAAAETPDALVVLGGDLNDEPGSETLAALEEGGALIRVARSLPQDAQATFIFSGRPVALDHIYATAQTASRLVAGSPFVVRDHPTGLGGSDHAALRADFTLEP
jgi:uncharacterized protein